MTETLRRLAREGLDGETVRASLNTCEFRLRENNTGSYPRGLILMLRSLTTWLYDGDPFEPLSFEAPLAAVRERALKGGWLEGLIERCLLDNPHRTTLFLRPDAGQAGREEGEEKARLAAARAGMDEAEVERLRLEAQELRARQEAPDDPADLAKLPRLQLTDLDREVPTIPLERAEAGGAPGPLPRPVHQRHRLPRRRLRPAHRPPGAPAPDTALRALPPGGRHRDRGLRAPVPAHRRPHRRPLGSHPGHRAASRGPGGGPVLPAGQGDGRPHGGPRRHRPRRAHHGPPRQPRPPAADGPRGQGRGRRRGWSRGATRSSPCACARGSTRPPG